MSMHKCLCGAFFDTTKTPHACPSGDGPSPPFWPSEAEEARNLYEERLLAEATKIANFRFECFVETSSWFYRQT